MSVRVEVPDPEPLIDDPVGFRVVGLRPGQVVTVRAGWRMASVAVSSEGRYAADGLGAVAPGSQPSLGGTYAGEDPYGLWWSARGAGRPPGLDAVPTSIAVLGDGGGELASASLNRRWVGDGVKVAPLHDGGLVGLSFTPAGPGPFPAVMVLGGSTGGLAGADAKAALLASRGVAALAVAYFGADGLPPGLAGVALEYLESGLAWLLDRPYVAGAQVAVLGSSRGAELALLLGATCPEVGSVVAGSPSGVVWPGAGPGAEPGVAPWTRAGRPVPAVTSWRPEALSEACAHDPIRLEPVFTGALADIASVAGAEIPIERSHGPILLISGDDDAMWPATPMADAMGRRARRYDFSHTLRHLRYPGAGHLCPNPPGLPLPSHIVHPLDGRRYEMGGSAAGNAAAAAGSWAATLDLLRTPQSVP